MNLCEICDNPLNENNQYCLNCLIIICESKLDNYKDKDKIIIPVLRKIDSNNNQLTRIQKKVITYVQKKSKIESDKSYLPLLSKIKSYGYTENDLKILSDYIKNEAPIIIHFNIINTLEKLVNDTCYRNTLEVNNKGKSYNDSRKNWEDNLFNNLYYLSTPQERVKYGVLNITNDPNGVSCCYGYGDSYLLLKNVRFRTTFANQDTSCLNTKVSTCEFYNHVLLEYNLKELSSMIKIAHKIVPFVSSKVTNVYKEVQIHGNIELNRDIEAIVVNKKYSDDTKILGLLETFKNKNNCNVIWMEE